MISESDIQKHQKIFDNFMRFTAWGIGAIIVFLLLMWAFVV